MYFIGDIIYPFFIWWTTWKNGYVTFIKSVKGLFAHLGNELTRAVNQIGPR